MPKSKRTHRHFQRRTHSGCVASPTGCQVGGGGVGVWMKRGGTKLKVDGVRLFFAVSTTCLNWIWQIPYAWWQCTPSNSLDFISEKVVLRWLVSLAVCDSVPSGRQNHTHPVVWPSAPQQPPQSFQKCYWRYSSGLQCSISHSKCFPRCGQPPGPLPPWQPFKQMQSLSHNPSPCPSQPVINLSLLFLRVPVMCFSVFKCLS